MRRQRQEAGAGSINLQAGRDIFVVNQVAGSAEDDGNDVEARVHRAFLYSDPRTPSCFFVNVFNASSVRETTVTHVWFETDPRKHALARKPGRVAPLSQWETWVEAEVLPFSLTRYEWLARVQLADGRVIESVPREDAPEVGYVPGEVYSFAASGTAASGSYISSCAASTLVVGTAVTGTAGPMETARHVDLAADVHRGSERPGRGRKPPKRDVGPGP